MKKATSKKMTIDDLAVMMSKGFSDVNKKIDKVDKKIDTEISNLAIIVAKGFESVHNEMDERFNKVEKDISEVKENLATTRMEALNMGDKFVSRHSFDQHLIRFDLLEQKVKTRK